MGNNAAWTNTGGALATANQSLSVRFNSGLAVAPAAAHLTMTGSAPVISVNPVGNVVTFPMAAANRPTQKMALWINHPQPDSAGTVRANERHKIYPAGLPLRYHVDEGGGVAPFHYDISGFSGLTIGADLPTDWETNGPGNHAMVMCDNPPLGTNTIIITTTDQNGVQKTRQYTATGYDKNDTTRFRFYDSLNGSNSNPGSYDLPYKDNWALANGATSSDTTYQGHVIFINRGTSYLVGQHSGGYLSLDNTKRPVVFYSLPISGSRGNPATFDWTGRGIAQTSNQAGLYFGELIFSGGDSSAANYRTVTISDGQDRISVCKVTIINPVNGSVGTDNPTAFFFGTGATSADSSYNHFISFFDVWESGRTNTSNGNSAEIYKCYGIKYIVTQFCGNRGVGLCASMELKDSCINTQSRYLRVDNHGSGCYAVDRECQNQFGGGPNANTDYAYCLLSAADAGGGRAVRFNAYADAGMGSMWLTRCTIANGVVDMKLPNTSTGPLILENCVIQASGSPLVINATNVINTGTECQGASGIIDASYHLTGTSRTNQLYKRGLEIG